MNTSISAIQLYNSKMYDIFKLSDEIEPIVYGKKDHAETDNIKFNLPENSKIVNPENAVKKVISNSNNKELLNYI